MNKIRKIGLLSALVAATALSACEKEFLDINKNPNLPLSSTPDLVLPSGIGSAAYVMSYQYQILGNFWAQNWTQSLVASQYKDLDRYQVGQDDYDRPWQTLYAGSLNDFKYVSDRATGDSVNYGAIAGLMQAYTYQVLVDGYDKVPFSEALQGNANINPRYDDGQLIYDQLITLINASVAKISSSPTQVDVGASDVIFNGDMDKWRRFANTLKLKIYLRQVYARESVARDSIQALYQDGAEFLGAGEDAAMPFVNSTNNQYPFYAIEFGGSNIKSNIIASNTALGYLIDSTADPRVNALYRFPLTPSGTTTHRGADQGRAGINNTGEALNLFSRPGELVAGPTTSFPFISGPESLFLQAEAALRGYAMGANAKAIYNDAITASFDMYGVTGAGAFLATPAIDLDQVTSAEEKLDRLITQKWVALNGRQGFEAWTELRRTGYPSLINPSLSSVLPAGRIPERVPYPLSEAQRNSNAPAFVRLDVPVWWDKRP